MLDNDFSWVTNDMFQEKLIEILDNQDGESLIMIPGLYEVVSEYVNNDVLEALEQQEL